MYNYTNLTIIDNKIYPVYIIIKHWSSYSRPDISIIFNDLFYSSIERVHLLFISKLIWALSVGSVTYVAVKPDSKRRISTYSKN